jgi:hypothetical protein
MGDKMKQWKPTGKEGVLSLKDKHGVEHFYSPSPYTELSSIREEQKYPESKEEQPGSKLDDMLMLEVESKELKKCDRCGKDVPPKAKACIECGLYQPSPGETFDISKVDFTLPSVLGSRLPPTERSMNAHDQPPPNVSGTAVSTSREMNEWVLNHLPLTEDQKDELLDDLIKEKGTEMKDRVLEERDETREVIKGRIGKEIRLKRKSVPRTESSTGRTSVKDHKVNLSC